MYRLSASLCRLMELWLTEPITETAEHVIEGQRDRRSEGWTERAGWMSDARPALIQAAVGMETVIATGVGKN